MHLQYLSDCSGKQTAVVIPIEEWKALITKYSDLQSLELDTDKKSHSPGSYTMADFMGTISSATADSLLANVDKSRNEWDRNF